MTYRTLSTVLCVDFMDVYGDVVNHCSLFLSHDGQVNSVGIHSHNGHGHEKFRVFPPTRIPSLQNIKSIDCGLYHTVCLDYNGVVFTIGTNMDGQLGVENDLYRTHVPQLLDSLPPIKQISCGASFTICVCESGDVYAFGSNDTGQLGLGNYSGKSPLQIECLSNIDFVACGSFHAICKSYSGEIFAWGSNDKGQLGINKKSYKKTKPVKCNDWPNNVVDIKCGERHTLVLTSNQEVFSCGSGYYGQLGRDGINNKYFAPSLQIIEGLKEIIRIECGITHSFCIDINNELYVFGDNKYGQLGLGHEDEEEKPIKHPSLSNIIDISTGGNHTFVKTSNNEIYAFGYNNHSQLGIETEDDNQLIPIRVFEDNEDIWFSNINKSKAKSARF